MISGKEEVRIILKYGDVERVNNIFFVFVLKKTNSFVHSKTRNDVNT